MSAGSRHSAGQHAELDQYLFSNPGGTWVPFFNQGAGKALIAAAGLTPAYNDLGDVSNG